MTSGGDIDGMNYGGVWEDGVSGGVFGHRSHGCILQQREREHDGIDGSDVMTGRREEGCTLPRRFLGERGLRSVGVLGCRGEAVEREGHRRMVCIAWYI